MHGIWCVGALLYVFKALWLHHFFFLFFFSQIKYQSTFWVCLWSQMTSWRNMLPQGSKQAGTAPAGMPYSSNFHVPNHICVFLTEQSEAACWVPEHHRIISPAGRRRKRAWHNLLCIIGPWGGISTGEALSSRFPEECCSCCTHQKYNCNKNRVDQKHCSSWLTDVHGVFLFHLFLLYFIFSCSAFKKN